MHIAHAGLLLLLSLSPSLASAQSITPVFRWPATATATIVSESRRAPDAPALTSSGTLEVRPQGDLLIVKRPVPRPPQADTTNAMRAVTLATAELGYAVRRDGAFVSLVDTTALHVASERYLAEQVQRMRAQGANYPPEIVERTIARLLGTRDAQFSSVAYQTRIRQRTWEGLGHGVAGRTWSPGDSQLTIMKEPMLLGPGITTEFHTVTRYVGTVPCPNGATGTCWQFTTRAYTSPESYVAAMREQFQSMLPAGLPVQEPTITPPSSVTTAEIIVSAETLLPLRIESRFHAPGVRDRPATDTHTVSTYSWKY